MPQNLLLARRLCERGCGFVTVTTNFVWDMHADGGGLNKDRILAKAIEKGIIAADAELSDDATYAQGEGASWAIAWTEAGGEGEQGKGRRYGRLPADRPRAAIARERGAVAHRASAPASGRA